MKTFILYSTEPSWKDEDPTFYGVFDLYSEAEEEKYRLIDKVYTDRLDNAIKYSIDWLEALSDYDWCTWDSHNISVYFGNREYGFDELDELEEEIERHVTGQAIVEYINQFVPKFKIETIY